MARRRSTSSTTRRGGAHLRVVREAGRRPSDAMHAARVSMLLLLGPTAVLTVLGLAMVLSAGSVSATRGYDGNPFWYFQRQGVYAVGGVVALLATAKLPHVAWKKLAVPMLVAAVPLMLISLHPSAGTSLYGASRWIDLGPLTVQPSEFLKLAMVAFTATVLTRKWTKLDDPAHLLIPLAPVVLLVALLVIMQRDLGTTVIICGTVFLMLFAAGVRLRYLVITGAVALAGTAYLIFGEAYRRTRFVDSFLNPWNDPEGAGFQLIQGLIAFGSGGWTGVGLGASRQKWDYLPNAHSDFIFAILGEELGLLGALFVMAMFAMLLYAGVRIAIAAPDTFGRLLAAGITGWIGIQTIVNICAVTGLMPITGVPLPLLSFGGTALVVTLAGVGVLASIARAGATASRSRRTVAPRGPSRTGAPRAATTGRTSARSGARGASGARSRGRASAGKGAR